MEIFIIYKRKSSDVGLAGPMLLSRFVCGLLLFITCWSSVVSVDADSGDIAGNLSSVSQTQPTANESHMSSLRSELSTPSTTGSTAATVATASSGEINQTPATGSHRGSSTQMVVASKSSASVTSSFVDNINQSTHLSSVTLNHTNPTVAGVTTPSSVVNYSSTTTPISPEWGYSTPFNTSSGVMTVWPSAPTVPTKMEEDKKFPYYSYKIVNNDEAKFQHYWKQEEEIVGSKHDEVLEKQYLTAVTVKLNFTFFFYGHEIDSVTLATGGFLYMSDFLHDRLTYSQYIAPLMANFGTEFLNHSHIHYAGNGTAFTVWWENVTLKDDPSAGQFSFQVTLYNTGHVVFAYGFLPMAISGISSKYHSVRVGLADAFYFDEVTSAGYTERKISEYSRVLVETSAIRNHSLVLIEPLPTCIQQKTCSACLAAASTLTLPCQWCSQLKRCSDGYDRKRQQWLKYGCNTERVTGIRGCSGNRIQLGFVTFILIVAVTLLATGCWLCYAHNNPNSGSGRWLIEHRPKACVEAVGKMSCCGRPMRRERYVSYESGLESLA